MVKIAAMKRLETNGIKQIKPPLGAAYIKSFRLQWNF